MRDFRPFIFGGAVSLVVLMIVRALPHMRQRMRGRMMERMMREGCPECETMIEGVVDRWIDETAERVADFVLVTGDRDPRRVADALGITENTATLFLRAIG